MLVGNKRREKRHHDCTMSPYPTVGTYRIVSYHYPHSTHGAQGPHTHDADSALDIVFVYCKHASE